MKYGSRRFVAPLAVLAAILTACGSNSSPKSTSSAKTTTDVGVEVTGGFGTKPTVTIPDKPAPSQLTQQVLTRGTGAAVAKGDTLVVNYLGQTWAPKNGKPAAFVNSFVGGSPDAVVIGVGRVLPGWDKALVGKNVGIRLLLTLPPADGYGSAGQSSAGILGTDTLVFLIDIVASYKPDASAPGTVVANLPASGLPKIDNVPGAKPTITSIAGVKIPTARTSTLLVTGSGEKIDSTKTLVLQLVQADLATDKKSQSTWGQAPTTVAAKSVLSLADKLTGQNVGSRAVVLLPATAATNATPTQAAQPASPPEVLIIDVVGQF